MYYCTHKVKKKLQMGFKTWSSLCKWDSEQPVILNKYFTLHVYLPKKKTFRQKPDLTREFVLIL